MLADDSLDRLLTVARGAAADAAALLRGVRAADIRHKGNPRDLVTEWDVRSEALIRERLRAGAPDIAFVGEEGGGAGGHVRWLVDPIDGTTNFAHGMPFWAVSIGLVVGQESVVGVIEAPALGWQFWARRGGGAYGDMGTGVTRLAVSAVRRLGDALLTTGFPCDHAISSDSNFAQWEHFHRRASACRRLGAASLDLALVARGMLDGYWERGLKPWDAAAGVLLVTEAGGRVTDPDGRRFVTDVGDVVATNGAIHDAVVAELAVADARGFDQRAAG
ncbi:MAG: inositol monophosphatase [Deltaproteobacteria bacterium]|nr:inositol monophosphatase [Deltaproteobacteria bacterium]